MTLPRGLLAKEGGLDREEHATMRRHSLAGHDILLGAGLREEARIVLHHHERPDAAGYPYGIAGEAIPLESRIILAADAFDAITSDRPYRAARPGPEALVELERCAGTQFDATCVRALRRRLTRPAVAV
jgi:HD-GYP domain-containing protein (c-di-GMP phosphodiesterase class II)